MKPLKCIIIICLCLLLIPRVEAQSPMLDMVYVKGGTYIMGDVWNKPFYLDPVSTKGNNVKEYDPNKIHGLQLTFDALDTHEVTVNDFYISRYELTVEWYDKYLEAIGQAEKKIIPDAERWAAQGWSREHSPAVYLAWGDAIRFCNWLSKQEGLDTCYVAQGNNYRYEVNANGYRLPTEAEWEYAARGGHLMPYIDEGRGSFYAAGCVDNAYSYTFIDEQGQTRESDNYTTRIEGKKHYPVLPDYAWFNVNAGPEETSFQKGMTHPVGQKKPNALGLYDMSGNAWEWCWDLYSYDYYRYCKENPEESNNPLGPTVIGDKGGVNCHVLRGGSWGNYPVFLRSTFRFFGLQQVLGNRECCNWRTGMRLVRSVK